MTLATDSQLAQMQQLEAQLLHTDFHKTPQQLELLLAEDFQEVSPTGSISTRAQVISWLLQKDPAHRWQFSEWQLSEPAPAVRLLRYHAMQCVPASPGKGARHVSLWCFNDKQHGWQLRFHQSSKVG
jgi:hypothetical protein